MERNLATVVSYFWSMKNYSHWQSELRSLASEDALRRRYLEESLKESRESMREMSLEFGLSLGYFFDLIFFCFYFFIFETFMHPVNLSRTYWLSERQVPRGDKQTICFPRTRPRHELSFARTTCAKFDVKVDKIARKEPP